MANIKTTRGAVTPLMPKTLARVSADELLAWFFHRNGYFRLADVERRRSLGSKNYKKGDEVRLVAKNSDELKRINSALKQVGLKPGKPFIKARSTIIPIYGKEAVTYFRNITKQWTKKKLADRHRVQ
ncbi:MAG: hypothetical protein N2246_03110 [Candidatus Sumerlaeia bacterium]|nr:hypothetical protein [Candidatus Sumerlaeia bacterium]